MDKYKVISKNGEFSFTYNALDLKDAKRYARFFRQRSMWWVDVKVYKNDTPIYNVLERAFKVYFEKLV